MDKFLIAGKYPHGEDWANLSNDEKKNFATQNLFEFIDTIESEGRDVDSWELSAIKCASQLLANNMPTGSFVHTVIGMTPTNERSIAIDRTPYVIPSFNNLRDMVYQSAP
jgi:hypothetical protein